jgi:hypothetical protein
MCSDTWSRDARAGDKTGCAGDRGVVGVDKNGFYSSACRTDVVPGAYLVWIHPCSFRSLFLIIPLPLAHSLVHRRSQPILEASRSRCRCRCRFRGLLGCALARSWCTQYRLSLEVVRIHLIPVYLIHFWFGVGSRRGSGFSRCASSLWRLSKSSTCTRWIGFLRSS